jgi:DNA invertase Pin-like site-specific DNA recombinase
MAPRELVPAAQYVRMSTDHQRYSITYQSRTNALYAARCGYALLRTYEDPGVSGLRLERRPALQRLLADIVGGDADFQVVVVYDVSRWGRFQDPDESAHYEFICREAGVRVEYSAEPFANDGSLASAIVKTVKRAMAAEYVRELSTKVRTAKRGLGLMGYWMGGIAPYGYRRCLIAPDGSVVKVLEPGERKALQGHRVVLVEGPVAETATVRRIFSLFVTHGLSYLAIADQLNGEGTPTGYGRPWSATRIRKILGDEVYLGRLVMGHYGCYLTHQVVHPRETWTRVAGACPQLVSAGVFEAAQANLRRHRPAASDAQLLDELRAAWRRHGRLSENILQRDPQARSGRIYERRFGSLTEAFARIGYQRTPAQQRMLEKLQRDRPHLGRTHRRAYTPEQLLGKLRALLAERGRLTTAMVDGTPGMPHSGTFRAYFGSLGRAYELVGYRASKHQLERCKPCD